MPGGKGKLTKAHGLVLRELLKGRTQSEIAQDEKVGINAIGMRLAKMKPFLDPRTLKRIEEARKARQNQLTDQDHIILAKTLAGKSAAQIAEEEPLISRETVRSRLRKIRAVDPQIAKRLYPRLTRAHGDIIRLRLQGKNYAEIAQELGYKSNQNVRTKFMGLLKYLHPNTVKRLHVGERFPENAILRQRIVEEFQRQLKKHLTRGAINATARVFGKNRKNIKHHLGMAGINSTGEIQRQRFNFMLRVAETMHLSHRIALERLGITSKSLLNKYRKRVQAGEHLPGPLELVEKPEAQQWWDMQMPAIREEGEGRARINLTVRNETVQKDLKFFDAAIKAVVLQAARNHEDKAGTRKRAKFDEAIRKRDRLRKAKKRYIELECTGNLYLARNFHDVLNKN